MYNENSFKNHLFWIKVKRVFYMILFSIIGSGVGVFISSYVVDILNFDPSYRFFIISGLTLLFFAISLLLTANTGKEVQDGYWKIEVLRKLTSISNKLDAIDNLDDIADIISQTKQALNIPNVEANADNNIATATSSHDEEKEELKNDDIIIENDSNNKEENNETKSSESNENPKDNKIINIENSKKINEINNQDINKKTSTDTKNSSTDSNIEPAKKKHNNKKNRKRKKNKKIA